MKSKRLTTIALLVVATVALGVAADKIQWGPSSAWRITDPLGERYEDTIDTLAYNYQRQAVPSLTSDAFATTGNLGAPALNMIFFERPYPIDFIFSDGLRSWLYDVDTQMFYNTRRPMTILSYNTGGAREKVQDRLRGTFSGNVNKRLQFGAMLDYIYSKGAYANQATKNFTFGFSTSYTGDRYELQAFYDHFSLSNRENGGIPDDRYITNPAEVLGGDTKIDSRTIPTNLDIAQSSVSGQQLYVNNRYKVGYYRNVRDSISDTIVSRVYVPVTSFIHTLDYESGRHRYRDDNGPKDRAFYPHTYLTYTGTDDDHRAWRVANTFGVQMLEGFKPWAKFGLAAYVKYEIQRYYQAPDSMRYSSERSTELDDFPDVDIAPRTTLHQLYVGAQLTKKSGSLLTYTVLGQFGVAGGSAGEVVVAGDINTRFKLWGDSLRITAYGAFTNLGAPFYSQQLVSNHYVWNNDFGMTRRFRVGGQLKYEKSNTLIDVGYETLQNYIYYNNEGMATQHSGAIHVLSARLEQKLHWRAIHWDNAITFQTTSNATVLPLPKLAIYSNLYLQFPIAKVLLVQLGANLNYYTRYYAPSYNPATMQFMAQSDTKVGNYPWIDAYVTCKLKKVRFFLMVSHVTQGAFNRQYFAIPHYPLNPRKFQLGLSVDLPD